MKTITIKEALEQGYIFCGTSKERFQSLQKIEELSDDDLKNAAFFVAEKEGISPSTNNADLAELIADRIDDEWSGNTGDDTHDIFHIIKELDFTETVKMINEALKDHLNYKITDIKLI